MMTPEHLSIKNHCECGEEFDGTKPFNCPCGAIWLPVNIDEEFEK